MKHAVLNLTPAARLALVRVALYDAQKALGADLVGRRFVLDGYETRPFKVMKAPGNDRLVILDGRDQRYVSLSLIRRGIEAGALKEVFWS